LEKEPSWRKKLFFLFFFMGFWGGQNPRRKTGPKLIKTDKTPQEDENQNQNQKK